MKSIKVLIPFLFTVLAFSGLGESYAANLNIHQNSKNKMAVELANSAFNNGKFVSVPEVLQN